MRYEPAVPLSPRLLEILACPVDHGPLIYLAREGILYNPRLHLRYRVQGDIPELLAESGEKIGESEHLALLALAESRGVWPVPAR